MQQMNEQHLANDVAFLTHLATRIDSSQRNPLIQHATAKAALANQLPSQNDALPAFRSLSSKLPNRFVQLQRAAQQRQIHLLLLPKDSKRHQLNSSKFAAPQQCIHWSVELQFKQSQINRLTHKVSEQTTLRQLLHQWMGGHTAAPARENAETVSVDSIPEASNQGPKPAVDDTGAKPIVPDDTAAQQPQMTVSAELASSDIGSSATLPVTELTASTSQSAIPESATTSNTLVVPAASDPLPLLSTPLIRHALSSELALLESNDLHCLMKVELQPASNLTFHKLDIDATLQDNLKQKVVIDYPTLLLVSSADLSQYKLHTSDSASASMNACRQLLAKHELQRQEREAAMDEAELAEAQAVLCDTQKPDSDDKQDKASESDQSENNSNDKPYLVARPIQQQSAPRIQPQSHLPPQMQMHPPQPQQQSRPLVFPGGSAVPIAQIQSNCRANAQLRAPLAPAPAQPSQPALFKRWQH